MVVCGRAGKYVVVLQLCGSVVAELAAKRQCCGTARLPDKTSLYEIRECTIRPEIIVGK